MVPTQANALTFHGSVQQDGVVVGYTPTGPVGSTGPNGGEPLRPAHPGPVTLLKGEELGFHQSLDRPWDGPDGRGIVGAADRVDRLVA